MDAIRATRPHFFVFLGDTIYAGSASGNMQSLVLQDFKDLDDYNPGVWNPTHPTQT